MGLLDKNAKLHSNASTQINVPKGIADQIIRISRELIPDEHLAGEGRTGEGAPPPHVTIKYGVTEDENALRQAVAGFGPATITLGATEAFIPSEMSDNVTPIVVQVHGHGLNELHEAVKKAMGTIPDDFPYVPHVTIAYVKNAEAQHYAGSDAFQGISFTANTITLSMGDDNNQVTVPLGKPVTAAAPTVTPEIPQVTPQLPQEETEPDDEEVQRDEPAVEKPSTPSKSTVKTPSRSKNPLLQKAPKEKPYKAPKPPVKNPNFKKWFGKSQVKDSQGKPLVVYHGTTHNFEAFDPSTAHSENYYGKALYFTSSTTDLQNYSTEEGPDITNRIENLTDRIFADIENEWDIDHPNEEFPDYGSQDYQKVRAEAREMAKQQVAGGTRMSVPVYLSIQNPVYVSKRGGTEFHIDWDEESGNESGSGVDLYNAMMLCAGNYYGADAQEIWNDIIEDTGGGDFTAYDFEKQVRNGDHEITDDNGSMVPGSFIAEVYQELGFDGIIQDAYEQFGPQALPSGYKTKGMTMDRDTRHYIIWDPTKVKSAIGNVGKFDPKNPVFTAAAAEFDDEEDFEEPQAWEQWYTIPAGTTLYHGTSTEWEENDELQFPAWFSTHLKVALWFAHRNGEGTPFIRIYRTTKPIEVAELGDRRDMTEFFEAYGIEDLGDPQGLAEGVADAGLSGWIIPDNYRPGDDIMLTSGDGLEFIRTEAAGAKTGSLREDARMLTAARTGVGDLGLAKKIVQEFMPVLGETLPEPELKISNAPRAAWLGQDNWQWRYREVPFELAWDDTTTISIQKSILNDENTLRRVMAHELCHHADHLINGIPELEKIDNKWSLMEFKRRGDAFGHGPKWRAFAQKFNAKYGTDFVTEKSDQSYVVEDQELPPYNILLKRDYDGTLAYEVSARLTSRQKRILDRMAQEKEGTEYRLVKTSDRTFMRGPLIGSYYWAHAKEEDVQQKLETLWESGKRMEPTGAAAEQDDVLKLMRERMRGKGWEVSGSLKTAIPQIDKLEHPVSKDYDRVRWVYQYFYDNRVQEMSWKDFQKTFPWAQNSTLFTQVRQNRPKITREDLERWMQEYQAKAKEYQNYELEHGTYHNPQTSYRDVEQLVLRVNQSASAAEIIGEDPHLKLFLDQAQQGSRQSGHPVGENTVGWLRIDFINDQWLLIDEVQSDLINAVELAKKFISFPTLKALMEDYKSETVKQKIKEMGATEQMFQHSKQEFARRGYTPEVLEDMKRQLMGLFKDWAETGIASIIEIARRLGIQNVAIHTSETIAGRDPDLEADKAGIYYDQLAKSFGFKKQQLDIGNLKGNFWVRTASQKTAMDTELYADLEQQILFEYNDHLGDKNYRMKWQLIPAQRLVNIFNEYMKTKLIHDEKGMSDIAWIVIKNIYKLAINTFLCGHESGDPLAWARDMLEPEELPEDYWELLPNFFDDEKGNWRLSDYAMKPLMGLADQLEKVKDPEQQLQLVDRVLNVVHQRSDLSSWFVEGGRATLNKMFKNRKLSAKRDEATTSLTCSADIEEFPSPVLVRWEPGMRWREVLKAVKGIVGEIAGRRVPWREIFIWASLWNDRKAQDEGWEQEKAKGTHVMYDVLHNSTWVRVGEPMATPARAESHTAAGPVLDKSMGDMVRAAITKAGYPVGEFNWQNWLEQQVPYVAEQTATYDPDLLNEAFQHLLSYVLVQEDVMSKFREEDVSRPGGLLTKVTAFLKYRIYNRLEIAVNYLRKYQLATQAPRENKDTFRLVEERAYATKFVEAFATWLRTAFYSPTNNALVLLLRLILKSGGEAPRRELLEDWSRETGLSLAAFKGYQIDLKNKLKQFAIQAPYAYKGAAEALLAKVADSHKVTPLGDNFYDPAEYGTETNANAVIPERVRGIYDVPPLAELAPQLFEKESKSDLLSTLKLIRPNIVRRAQEIYDVWDQSTESGGMYTTSEGGDVEFGTGGICDAIAGEIASFLADMGINTAEGGHEGDDHAWVIAYDDKQAFGVDIPHQLYERGGGYNWKKIPGVTFTINDVEIFPVDVDPSEFAKEGARGSVPEGTTFRIEILDSYKGETFARAEAWYNGEMIGKVDFNVMEANIETSNTEYWQEKTDEFGAPYWETIKDLPQEAWIKYVSVKPEYRRMGIATGMYEKIKEEFPGIKFTSSGTTEEGGKFRRKLKERGVLASGQKVPWKSDLLRWDDLTRWEDQNMANKDAEYTSEEIEEKYNLAPSSETRRGVNASYKNALLRKSATVSDPDIKVHSYKEGDDPRNRYRMDLSYGGKEHAAHMALIQYPDHLKVQDAYVEFPEFKGKGLGKRLYRAAMELAKQQGLDEIRSDFTITEDAAHVWKSLGATPFKDTPGASTRYKLKVAVFAEAQNQVQHTDHQAIGLTKTLKTNPFVGEMEALKGEEIPVNPDLPAGRNEQTPSTKGEEDIQNNLAQDIQKASSKTKGEKVSKTASPFPNSFDEWLQQQGGLEKVLKGAWEEYEGMASQLAEEDGKKLWQLSEEEENVYLNRAAYEDLSWRYQELLSRYDNFQYPLTVYRAIHLKPGEAPNVNKFGIYWTWDDDSARGYSATDDQRTGELYIFRGEIQKDAVDWSMTLRLNLDYNIGEEEKEVRLKSGAHINITGWKRADEPEFRQPQFKTVTASESDNSPETAASRGETLYDGYGNPGNPGDPGYPEGEKSAKFKNDPRDKNKGQVYLLHFDIEPKAEVPFEREDASKPFHARHYLGWATDAQARIQQHYEGTGAKIMQALKRKGITFTVARIWDNKDRNFERNLKAQGGLSRWCPICHELGQIPESRYRGKALEKVHPAPKEYAPVVGKTALKLTLRPDSNSGVDAAIAEINATYPENPMNNKERVLMEGGKPIAAIEVAPRGGKLRLKSVRSTEKGTGAGTKALNAVLAIADKHGVEMELTASPYGDEKTRLDKDQLVEWYKRHDFEDEEGRDPALGYMVRKPKQGAGPVDLKGNMYKQFKLTVEYDWHPSGDETDPDRELGEDNWNLVTVRAFDITKPVEGQPGTFAGYCDFVLRDNKLESANTEVQPEYRRQGVATAMYMFAEEVTGHYTKPHSDQSDAGQGLWRQKNRPFGAPGWRL